MNHLGAKMIKSINPVLKTSSCLHSLFDLDENFSREELLFLILDYNLLYISMSYFLILIVFFPQVLRSSLLLCSYFHLERSMSESFC